VRTVQQRLREHDGKVLVTAAWSDDGVFRYALARVWDDLTPAACFIGLHPRPDDEAMAKECTRIARELGCGGVLILNLFNVVTDRTEELTTLADPQGIDWLGFLSRAAHNTQPAYVIAAWGSHPKAVEVSPLVVTLFGGWQGVGLTCLGRLPDGAPVSPHGAHGAARLEQYP
jgi:hypothetical protein